MAVKNTKGKQGEGREGMVNPVIVIGCINWYHCPVFSPLPHHVVYDIIGECCFLDTVLFVSGKCFLQVHTVFLSRVIRIIWFPKTQLFMKLKSASISRMVWSLFTSTGMTPVIFSNMNDKPTPQCLKWYYVRTANLVTMTCTLPIPRW